MEIAEQVFPNIDTLVSHLKFLKKEDLTPIRLQKALYFLFAYYGASYGQLNKEKTKEGFFEGGDSDAYPETLFKEQFEAWKYGPVVPAVYHTYKNKDIIAKEWNPDDVKLRQVKEMIKDVIEQLDSMGDFELVDRSHEDLTWKNVYNDGKGMSGVMDHEDIVEEYKILLTSD